MSGKTTRAKCPYCSAEFEVPSTLVYTTCPYCGTTFKLDKPFESIEHYVFKLKYNSHQVFEHLKRFVSIQPGVPEDVKQVMSYIKSTLYYVPMYIFEVVVETPCLDSRILDDQEYLEASVLGGQETGFEVIPAVDNYPFPIPRNYSFPAQTREYFKPKIMREAIYLQPELNPYELLKTIVKPYLDKAVSEAELACPGNYEVVNKSSFKGIAHYPFWLVEYEYNGNTYRGVVDGADGTIIYLEYPLAKNKRAKFLVMGLIGAVLSSVLTLLFSTYHGGISQNTLLMGILAYTGGLYVFFSKFLGKKGVYNYNPSEEGVFAPPR